MKKALKKIWKKLNEPKLERTLIVVLPCLSVLLAAIILAPRLMYYIRGNGPAGVDAVYSQSAAVGKERSVSSSPVPSSSPMPSASPSPSPTLSPSPSVSPSPTVSAVKAVMSASSTERDLYVRIKDESGNAITGQKFSLTFDYPSGESYSFNSETDGTCYLVDLEPGDYTVSMNPKDGYESATDVVCAVKADVEYVQIEDIEEMIDVVDNTEIAQSEIKTQTETVEEIQPEVVSAPVDDYDGDGIIEESTPVLDTSGNQVFTYSFDLGPNGKLIYSANGQESDVIPVDENGDGTYEYGLQMAQDGVYQSVDIFNADNTPNALFSVVATPVTETVSIMIGWQTIDGNTYYYDNSGNKVTGLKSIDGLLYYFNQYGVRADSLGVDVSFYNEGINWPAVKAQGIDFAIIRVGGRGWETGLLYDDACFQQNISGAKAAGLKVGVYFYTTAVDAVEAVQEASLVLARLGGTSLDFPIYIDMEHSGDYPNGRSDQLSKAQRTEIINAFCCTVQNSGYSAGVYSGQNFYKYSMDYNSISTYKIWLASYTSFNQVPNFNGRYDMWQFTDSGVVNGIIGVVDMNAIFS